MRQLEKVLYLSADNPQTVPELVKARIAAEAEGPDADCEERVAVQAAGVFFPAWHVL